MADEVAPQRSDDKHAGSGRVVVSIRVKLIVAFVLTCAPMVAALGWFGLATASDSMREQALEAMKNQASLQAQGLEETIRRARDDVEYLVRSGPVGAFARSCAEPDGPSDEARRHVLSQFIALAEATEFYSQVRYIDSSGRERARVNYTRRAGATVVPDEELQDKSGRDYFRMTMATPPGAVIASPLELNREHGRMERPFHPVIRFSSPIGDGRRELGIVVLNVEAGPWLPRRIVEGGSTFLVDPQGWYLSHTDPSKAWSGPRNLDSGHNLQRDLGGEAGAFLAPKEGVVQRGDRLVATHPIILEPGFVVLGMEAGEEQLFAPLEYFRRVFWVVLAVSFVAPVLAGLTLASFFLRPVRKLRGAVHAVAEGNLQSTLDVRSGDEFQLLADDFNVMARRLREYRDEERLTVIGRMAATVIHDIRNPLSSLSVFARLLSDKNLPEEKRKDVAARALAQVQRILHMLQEILEFSRSGQAEIEKQTVDFEQLVADLESTLRMQCTDRGISLSVDNEADCTIEADREKLQRALCNVTANACEAMEEGGAVRIESKCVEDGVLIEVSDTGPGVSPEVADRIFEPFVSHGKISGTGLGLAITRAIVEAHGGRVSVRNRPEGGATFSIWLPRADGREPPS